MGNWWRCIERSIRTAPLILLMKLEMRKRRKEENSIGSVALTRETNLKHVQQSKRETSLATIVAVKSNSYHMPLSLFMLWRILIILSTFCLGYFIHDFIDMALNHRKKSSFELMIHHFFVITCFGLAELTHRYVGYAVVALLVEVNSVFLHLRQLMIIQGVSRQHPIYRLNSLFNIGTFLIFRILTLGWMTRWLVLHRDQVPFFAYTMGSIALAVIVLMNIVLFFRILQVDFLNKKGRSK